MLCSTLSSGFHQPELDGISISLLQRKLRKQVQLLWQEVGSVGKKETWKNRYCLQHWGKHFPQLWKCIFHKAFVSPICFDMSNALGYVIFLNIYSSMSIEIYFKNSFAFLQWHQLFLFLSLHTHFSGRKAVFLTQENLGVVWPFSHCTCHIYIYASQVFLR